MPPAAHGFLLVLVICLHAAGAVALTRLPGPSWHGEEPALLRASWIENSSSPSPPSVAPAELYPPVAPVRSAPRRRVRQEVSAVSPVVETAPEVPVDTSGDLTPISHMEASVAATSEAPGGGGKSEEEGRGRDYVGPDFNISYFSNPEPEYPSLSRRQREQGLVKLRVHVTEEGRAGEVMLHMSSGYDRLDRAALDAVRRWRFRPAQRAGTPVPGWVVVPVRFELHG